VVFFHLASLIVMHQSGWSFKLQNAVTTNAPPPPKSWRRTHMHQLNLVCSRYSYLFGSLRASIFLNSNIIILQIQSWITKLCKMAFAATMCTSVHLAVQMNTCVLCLVYILAYAHEVCFLWVFPFGNMKSIFFILKAHLFKLISKTSILFFKGSNSFWSKTILGLLPLQIRLWESKSFLVFFQNK